MLNPWDEAPLGEWRPYFAISARGIETVTAEELTQLGAKQVISAPGGVHFFADLATLYRANLWLRTASRVLRPLRDFAAATPEMLYDQVRRIPWERYLDPHKTFAIDCKIQGAKVAAHEGEVPVRLSRLPAKRLTHSHYAALKIKDAIVDRLRKEQGARPDVDTRDPDLLIFAYLHGRRCTLSLDASGGSLHQRGYRDPHAAAPLKETLAAALLLLCDWEGKTPFCDFMCGSGTLPLEAAMIALNLAPGLRRPRQGFFSWPDFDRPLWERLHQEAVQQRRPPRHPILASDRDPKAIAAAQESACRLGIEKAIQFHVLPLEQIMPPPGGPGLALVNPPYGERLGEAADLDALYRSIGDTLKQRFTGWRAGIFTGNLAAGKRIGLRPSRRIPLFNGPIQCRLLLYDLY